MLESFHRLLRDPCRLGRSHRLAALVARRVALPGSSSATHERPMIAAPVAVTKAAISTALRFVIRVGARRAHLRSRRRQAPGQGGGAGLILSLVEHRARHGYEIGKLIDQRSEGRIRFKIASLYPLLYRLEEREWIKGTWVEQAGERRRRCYKVTAAGRRELVRQRETWATFVESVRLITGDEHA